MGDDRVSRMAAVLVEAAGGRIEVPLSLINEARFINLHQTDDRARNVVIYTTKRYGRAAAGPIIEGEAVVVENRRALPDRTGDE